MTNTDTVGTLSGVENTFFKPSGTFKGVPYFDCDHDTFCQCLKGKQKGARWNTFMGKSEYTDNIKSWIASNKNTGFMLRSNLDGSFIYAHKSL